MSKRDEWMLGGEGIDRDSFSSILGSSKERVKNDKKLEAATLSAKIQKERELNPNLRENKEPSAASFSRPSSSGSLAWTKVLVQRSLDRVKRGEAAIEDVAAERFGDMKSFEEACRSVSINISPYLGQKPRSTIELSNQTPHTKSLAIDTTNIPEEDINKLVAKKMKAELAGNYEVARKLGKQIECVQSKPNNLKKEQVTLLPKEAVLAPIQDTDDIKKMLQSEKLGPSNEYDEELAKNIMKNSRYGDKMKDLEDMSARFSANGPVKERQKRSDRHFTDPEEARKRVTLENYTKMQKLQGRCWFCLDSERVDKSLIVAYGNFTYLAIPKYGQLDPFHVQIIPNEHAPSTLQCEDGIWDEVRNFKKCLLQMAATQNKQVLFLEASTRLKDGQHCFIDCVPLPANLDVDPTGYFRKALYDCDAEWTQHKRIIDTSETSGGLRRAIPKNFPFIYVDFRLDQGFAHVVEDEEVVGPDFLRILTAKLLGKEGSGWRKERTVTEVRVAFLKAFKPFDWTKLLHP